MTEREPSGRYPDPIERRRADLWRQTELLLGGAPIRRGRLTDYEFAEHYLKGPMFPLDGPSRWFDPAPMHLELSALADQHARLLVQLPREFAKSSLFSLIRPLRLICEQPNIRGVIISKTQPAAEKFTSAIKHQLEANAQLIADFGPFKSAKWSDAVFTVVRGGAFKEPTLQAVGRGGQIVSGRYDFVVLDDVEDYESTRTDASRLKTYEWLMLDVVPVVVPGGHLYVVQTPQHEGDLVGQLRETAGIWKLVNIPAETETTDAISGKTIRVSNWPSKWPIYYTDCAVKKAEEKGASQDRLEAIAREACGACAVYSPAKADTRGVGCLTGKRFEVRSSVFYRLQYLVDITAFGGGYFKPEWWQYYTREQLAWDSSSQQWFYYEPAPGYTASTFDPQHATKHRLEIVIGVDPAIAEENDQAPDETRSHFASVVLGYVPKLRRRLLLDYVNRRVDFPTQKRIILEQFTTWSPGQIGIEDVAYQKALRQEIVAEYHLPITPMKADSDKFRRIVMLTPECEAGNVYLLAKPDPDTGHLVCVQTEFKAQAESFPRGRLRDLLDAWHYADRLVRVRPMLEEFAGQARSHPREIEQAEQHAQQQMLWSVAETLRQVGDWW